MTSYQVNAEPSVDVCLRQSGGVTEIFLNARPQSRTDLARQATALMDSAAWVIRRHEATILQERVFAHPAAMESLAQARARAFGRPQDPIEPTWLVVPENDGGLISGLQVHAVAGCGAATLLSTAGRPRGRIVQAGAVRYLTGCNLQGTCRDSAVCQTRTMLGRAEELLAQAGGSLTDIARTWMWLGGILDWYEQFNSVRNEFYGTRGLLQVDGTGTLPASTGIGIGPAGPRSCAMDFCATLGGSGPRFLLGSSRQGPASKYGSAFSRAAVAETPAGRTVYVSGTAAIDAAGRTTHVGDARGQIADTIENVRAVLRDASVSEQDIVQAIVYCKDGQVERIFRHEYGDLPMPYVLTIADVCRENLLFEIEVTAMPQ